MSDELKTLDEIDGQSEAGAKERTIDTYDLRQEAIKWIWHYRMNEDYMKAEGIKEFIGLKEEDLK